MDSQEDLLPFLFHSQGRELARDSIPVNLRIRVLASATLAIELVGRES